MILTSSRYLYQISDDHLLPKYFRKYNNKIDVAQNGILISAVIGILVLFAGNIYIIAAISNFGLLFNYLIVGLDVMHFRRNKFNSPFKMPLYPYLPVVGMILIFIMLAGMPNEALIIGSVMIMLLIAAYYVLREAEMKKVIRIKLFK
jgi:amino acid/polyamine/organocation transporter, APC superfamily (TC 2.A.3)